MPCPTITVPKFVGTVSLGLLTGLSYTLTNVSLPALLSLPSATSCTSALAHLETVAISQRRFLTALSILPLTLAYIRSPRLARHPYLIWTSLFASIATFGVEPLLNSSYVAPYLPSDPHAASASTSGGERYETTSVGSSSLSDDGMEVKGSWVGVKGARDAEEGKSEEEVNGEAVRARVERWRVTETIRASFAGAAFAMSVVGLWGDGY